MAEVRSPVRPVLDTIQIPVEAPGQLRILLLDAGPSPLILESFLQPSRPVEVVAILGGGGEGFIPGGGGEGALPVWGVDQGVERLHEHLLAGPEVVIGNCGAGVGR